MPAGQCTFNPVQTCQSTDSTVALRIYYYGDTAHCLFTWYVYWGDGHSTQNLSVIAPADGYRLLAQHTYATPGVYTILVTGEATPGCTAQVGTHTFNLLAPAPTNYQCSCVLYVRYTLQAHGINLGPEPTASAYTQHNMRTLGWSHVTLPNNGAIPDGDQPMVMIFDAGAKGADGHDGHMAIVVNAWSREWLGATGKSPWYNYRTKEWNITVMQDDWSTDPSNCTPAQHLFNRTPWGNLYGINFYVPDN